MQQQIEVEIKEQTTQEHKSQVNNELSTALTSSGQIQQILNAEKKQSFTQPMRIGFSVMLFTLIGTIILAKLSEGRTEENQQNYDYPSYKDARDQWYNGCEQVFSLNYAIDEGDEFVMGGCDAIRVVERTHVDLPKLCFDLLTKMCDYETKATNPYGAGVVLLGLTCAAMVLYIGYLFSKYHCMPANVNNLSDHDQQMLRQGSNELKVELEEKDRNNNIVYKPLKRLIADFSVAEKKSDSVLQNNTRFISQRNLLARDQDIELAEIKLPQRQLG